MTHFINLTPHAINVLAEDKSPHFVLPPSGGIARVTVTRELVEMIRTNQTSSGVAVYRTKFGPVTGLPEEYADVRYVVSVMVKMACTERTDLLSPGELVRNDVGQPIGCIGLDL